ncbi:MAG: hypothetical protein PUB39_05860 [Eubacteriales bacterium]|nr:hypothetical protein [Eubacteriales bacterium]
MDKEIRRSDFAVSGDNPVTQAIKTGNVLTLLEKQGYKSGFVTFVSGDDFMTRRGITFPASLSDIEEAYGDDTAKPEPFDPVSDRVYINGKANNMEDTEVLEEAETVLMYEMPEGSDSAQRDSQLRFYLDKGGNLVLAAYCMNYSDIPLK